MIFKKMDKQNQGFVSFDVLLTQYNPEAHYKFKSGEMSKKDVIEEFVRQWDSLAKEGQVSREEFEIYSADISTVVDDDAFFIPHFADYWFMKEQYEQVESLNNKKLQGVSLNGTQQNPLEKNTQKFWGAV